MLGQGKTVGRRWGGKKGDCFSVRLSSYVDGGLGLLASEEGWLLLSGTYVGNEGNGVGPIILCIRVNPEP